MRRQAMVYLGQSVCYAGEEDDDEENGKKIDESKWFLFFWYIGKKNILHIDGKKFTMEWIRQCYLYSKVFFTEFFASVFFYYLRKE